MPTTVIVIDPDNVTLNGVASGSITDVARNHPAVTPSEIQKAIKEWLRGLRAEHAAELNADRDARQAAIDARDARIADRDAKIAEKQALIDALGGTDEGKRLAKAARKAELLQRRAAAEAELSALDADGK